MPFALGWGLLLLTVSGMKVEVGASRASLLRIEEKGA